MANLYGKLALSLPVSIQAHRVGEPRRSKSVRLVKNGLKLVNTSPPHHARLLEEVRLFPTVPFDGDNL